MSKAFSPGDRVHLVAVPDYIKTAEPVPMLRSASLIRLGEEGVVLGRQPGNFWSVRFEKGAYLLDGQYLELVPAP